MLYLLATWLVLAAVTGLIGIALSQPLNMRCFDRISDRLLIALWIGTVLLAQGLLLLAAITPLSFWVLGVIAFALSGLLLWRPPVQTELRQIRAALSPSVLLRVVGLSTLTAAYMSQQVSWIDTGIYHYGAIRWFSEFGTVPGLALIINNLGFTSAWFALAAPFSPEAIATRTNAVTNGFVFLLIINHAVVAAPRWLAGQARVTDKFILVATGAIVAAITTTHVLSAILVSSSPDIPVILLTVVMAWSILYIANSAANQQCSDRDMAAHQRPLLRDPAMIPLLLAAGAVSIKLSALPLLPIAWGFYWSRSLQDWRRWLVGSSLLGLLLLPMALTGLIHSGCPLFPSTAFCVDLPWQVSGNTASQAAETIGIWNDNHALGTPPDAANQWLWRLGSWLQLAQTSVVMVVLMVISLLVSKPTLKTAHHQATQGVSWLISLGLLGMGFVLLKGPLLRFGLGYFTLIPALAIAVLGFPGGVGVQRWWSQRAWRSFASHPRSRLLSCGVWLLGALYLSSSQLQTRWLIPPPMPSIEVELRQSADVEYFTPASGGNRCWDAPLPCSPSSLKVKLRVPQKGIKAGFLPIRDES